jgi:hypothetical protein
MRQIEVENNTPYRRRIFLHPMQLSINEPVPLMLSAWKHFDLGPGETAGTATGPLRVGARVGSGTALDHRTVVADANLEDRWTYGLKDGIPTLTGGKGGYPNQVQVSNALSGPDAAAIKVTIFWDYSPWISTDVAPQFNATVAVSNRMFAYASKPIVDGSSALVFEPVAGEFQLSGDACLKLIPSSDGTTVQWESAGR